MPMHNYTHLQFIVPGTPVAKGRPKFRRAGAYVQTYTPKETLFAEMAVGKAFLESFPEFAVFVGDAKTVLPRNAILHYVDVWNRTRTNRNKSRRNSSLGKANFDSGRAGELKAKGAANGIALTCKFYCPIPASFSKRKRERLRGQFCLKKPDIDNYVKLVCDALNGIAWEDDNVIANLVAVKMYDEQPRTEVHIYYLEEGLDKCENMCYTNNVHRIG